MENKILSSWVMSILIFPVCVFVSRILLFFKPTKFGILPHGWMKSYKNLYGFEIVDGYYHPWFGGLRLPDRDLPVNPPQHINCRCALLPLDPEQVEPARVIVDRIKEMERRNKKDWDENGVCLSEDLLKDWFEVYMGFIGGKDGKEDDQ